MATKSKELRIKAAIDIDAAQNVVHGLDNDQAANEFEIGIRCKSGRTTSLTCAMVVIISISAVFR